MARAIGGGGSDPTTALMLLLELEDRRAERQERQAQTDAQARTAERQVALQEKLGESESFRDDLATVKSLGLEGKALEDAYREVYTRYGRTFPGPAKAEAKGVGFEGIGPRGSRLRAGTKFLGEAVKSVGERGAQAIMAPFGVRGEVTPEGEELFVRHEAPTELEQALLPEETGMLGGLDVPEFLGDIAGSGEGAPFGRFKGVPIASAQAAAALEQILRQQ